MGCGSAAPEGKQPSRGDSLQRPDIGLKTRGKPRLRQNPVPKPFSRGLCIPNACVQAFDATSRAIGLLALCRVVVFCAYLGCSLARCLTVQVGRRQTKSSWCRCWRIHSAVTRMPRTRSTSWARLAVVQVGLGTPSSLGESCAHWRRTELTSRVILGGRPDRGASTRPGQPRFWKRCNQRRTVSSDWPVMEEISCSE
jgi:hypothetical protein